MNVYGLTSAATIWCTASLGVLVGTGMYQLAVTLTLIILTINSLINKKSKKDD
jgi:putative Mg2+ transporter-C (MgtC) family protein